MTVIKSLTLLIFLAWFVYWQVEAQISHKKNPLTSKPSVLYQMGGRLLLGFLFGISVYQIFKNPFFPLPISLTLAASWGGLVLMLGGFIIALSARRSLNTNWASAFEYQIKQHHTLVTSGIYHVIRHPIYVAIILFLISMNLVAGSWLFIAMFFCVIPAYVQGKKEEALLEKHFGKAYSEYKKHTAMLIPYIL